MTTAIHAEATKTAKKPAKAKAAVKPAVKAPAKAKAPKAAKEVAAKAPAKARAPKAAKAPVEPVRPKGISATVVNRPASGVLLFAYTQAALDLLDMYNGASVDKAKLAKVMGLTAINYHTSKGTLERLANGTYALTVAGVAFFTERAARATTADVEAWQYVMTTGRADGVVCKNQDMIVAA